MYHTIRELLEKGYIDWIRRASRNSQLTNGMMIQEVLEYQKKKFMENEGLTMVEKNLLINSS